jgi:hybrid cluster-associated redox disulfide protein
MAKKSKKLPKRKHVTKKKLLITKEMTIGEIIEKYPKAAQILLEEGLMCVSCGMAQMETLEQGALSHNLDVNKLLKALNNSLK